MKESLKRILKASAYSAVTILVIIATIILVAIGRGYFFDIKTGEVSGGGLVLVGSRPDNAEVLLNDESLKKGTPSRLNLRAGNYKLGLQKEGFRPWHKDISVITSEVTWAQYPFLFPQTITTNTVATINQPLFATQSIDKKFLAIGLSTDPQQIGLYELGKNELKTIYTLSPQQINDSLTLGAVTWADDNEHILITLNSPTGPRYVVLNVLNPTEQFDLNQIFGVNLNGITFSTQNWRELYWVSPEGLRKLDLGNQTISAVLATNVVRFIPTDDAIFLTQLSSDGMRLVRLDRNNQAMELSPVLPVADYLLQYTNFEQKSRVILADKTNQSIAFYNSGEQNQETPVRLEHAPVDTLLISPDERILVSFKEDRFISYSFEFSRTSHFNLSTASFGPLTWFDNYHLMSTIDNATVVFEFDGANQESIVTSLGGLPGFTNKNQEYLYSFGRSDASSSFQLQASKIRP